MENKHIIQDEVTPLFAIPLCKTSINPVDDEVINYLKNLEYKPHLYSNAQNSVNVHVLDEPIVKPLRDQIYFKLDSFMHNFLGVDRKHKFIAETSWMNKYEKNDWSGEHAHANSLISGVLYLSDVKDTGNINFHKDRSWKNIFTDTVLPDFTEEAGLNVYNANGWSFQPKKWELVMFPSHLLHSVSPNRTDGQIRWSLAFNCFIRGPVGDGASNVVL
tara:strand:+ start:8116 stop:8766 length:651 start_codon:yes stop_codon:yes gene_type:complete